MKNKLYDFIAICAAFILLSDFSSSVYAYNMGFLRFTVPVIAAIIASVPFVLSHKTPLPHSWKGIVYVITDILILGCSFIGMCMLNLWGFVKTSFLTPCTVVGFNFLTTAWIIYFVVSLLVRLTVITEKLFHWLEKRRIKIKLIE